MLKQKYAAVLTLVGITGAITCGGVLVTGCSSSESNSPPEDSGPDQSVTDAPSDQGTGSETTVDASDGGASDASDGGVSDASDGGVSDASDGGHESDGGDASDGAVGDASDGGVSDASDSGSDASDEGVADASSDGSVEAD